MGATGATVRWAGAADTGPREGGAMGAIPAGAEIGVAITAPPQDEPEQELAATVGAAPPPQGGDGLSTFALENELG